MTKQEILDNIYNLHEVNKGVLSFIPVSFPDTYKDVVLKAMDLFAKQEVIEELESLLDRIKCAYPEYAAEIISERISEIKSPSLP